jgi:ribosomal protein S18 acetylase RimI-like enzyme
VTASIHIREGRARDATNIAALLPRLAAFGQPAPRAPEELWHDDAKMLAEWAAGNAADVRVHVAVDDEDALLGAAITRLRPEPLSHAPSAHLEVLVVADHATKRGAGQALMGAAEKAVRAEGATSMTLHVFAGNTAARALYERLGYRGELLRYIRFFDASST